MEKLTLSVPAKILSGAKSYSRRTRQPLSRLVSRYFSVLTRRAATRTPQVSSRVKRVTGIAKSARSDEAVLLDALHTKYR